MNPFKFEGMPRLVHGAGALLDLPDHLAKFGDRVLLVTGAHSFVESEHYGRLMERFASARIHADEVRISGEPTPDQIDVAVEQCAGRGIDVVVGIGGGAAVDAGKAIAAMIPLNEPATPYLEGVGDRSHPGDTKPYVAVPTTAGTGAEATKNAVISQVGEDGFKKSLRHDNFIPKLVILDPELSVGCPRNVTAACGLDALTQLLEAYTSPKATPLTDALALSGLEMVIKNLIPACGEKANDLNARSAMAYGAFLSGVTLAHAGLGIVHGFASPIGGFFDIPHGVVCGTLLPAATDMNIDCLIQGGGQGTDALAKYVQVGRMVSGTKQQPAEASLDLLRRTLKIWCLQLEIPKLSDYGVTVNDIDRIVAGSGLKNNPVQLDESQMAAILAKRID